MPDGKKNGKPTITSAMKKKAKELMKSYFKKKESAKMMEIMGKRQIKAKKKEGQFGTYGSYGITPKSGNKDEVIPVGKQWIDKSKKLMKEAQRDSVRAVRMNPGLIKKKK